MGGRRSRPGDVEPGAGRQLDEPLGVAWGAGTGIVVEVHVHVGGLGPQPAHPLDPAGQGLLAVARPGSGSALVHAQVAPRRRSAHRPQRLRVAIGQAQGDVVAPEQVEDLVGEP